MITFGEKLKEWRIKEDISVYSTACICGMNHHNYKQIEEGNNVTIKNILKITQALKLTMTVRKGKIKLKDNK